jgi:PAS domain S-box-containing protein
MDSTTTAAEPDLQCAANEAKIQALQESEEFLRETEKIARLGGWKANPHTDYLLWTEGVYDIIQEPLTYKPGFAEGLKYYAPEDHELIRKSIEACLATGTPFFLKVRITLGNGKKIWTELRGLRPVEEGTHFSVIGTIQDISERMIADDAATKTTSLLNAALDSTADGILIVDNGRDITGFNETFCSIWGIPDHALCRATETVALDYMEPMIPDVPGFIARLQELYAHPDRESYDTVSLTDGRIFERYSKPQKIGESNFGRVWSYRDITEQRQAEAALQETLEKFRIIATNTPDHILVQDRELRYTQVINPQLGLSEEDMIGRTDYEILSFEDAENLTTIKRRVLDHGTAVYTEFPLADAHGAKNYFAGSYVPKRNASGEIDGIIGYFKNVTETKRANEKIVAALAEKEILIREIHHRVKNNLQIISGLLDMTRMRTHDPATTSILTDMMMKIKTMAQIHTRLYESKQFDKINMGVQIRDQVADLSNIYGRSGPEITCQADVEDFLLTVDQAIPLALVVNEALSNAFKHAFRGRVSGTIQVSGRLEGGIVRIRIGDDGVGLPDDVDVSRATSLGLKLIRSLVLQLRGTLSIDSSSRGTQLIVDFSPGTGE